MGIRVRARGGAESPIVAEAQGQAYEKGIRPGDIVTHVGGASTRSPAAAHALDAERLVNVESGWDYVTVRVRLPPSLAVRGNGAEGQVAMRHRRSFPGAVTASGLVQLGPHNGTA